ncbi:cyclin-D3-1 [Artemisia annua]|uniref:Cyclin-D3-1 n=1 Tax=Artemisia annua TaxID=35608 RepID=A0A2U1N5A8_ARTAN|nr:cyclin-D3-1 [Artemisia annua]
MDLESVFNLPLQSDEGLTLLTLKQSEQFVGFVDYLHKLKDQSFLLVARQQAVDWISKVHTHFSFGPLCAYLSVNYLDRFLAVYELPKDKPWMIQLLAVTCLSLGGKMDETEMPLILDMQEAGGSRFVFEAKTIQRMELVVLRIDFLEFQPSEIASAVAIYVVGIEVENTQISSIFEYAKKERVIKCMELVTKNCTMSFGSGILRSLPESPIGVLEAAILRYKNDDSPTCAKRRRTQH